MDYSKLSMKEIIDLLQTKKVSSEELVTYYIKRIKEHSNKNEFLLVFEAEVIK